MQREGEQHMYSKDRYFTKHKAIFNEMKCTFREEKKYKFRGSENVNTLPSEVLMKRGGEGIQKFLNILYHQSSNREMICELFISC